MIRIDYLYLDLKTCDRCVGTDEVLEAVIKQLTPAFALAGYTIDYHKIEIMSEEDARKHWFLSSPTIRVNHRDICDEIIESDCGCCGEISGRQTDCRVFKYEGQLYEVPPKAMLAELILKYAFHHDIHKPIDNYQLPNNLKIFFEGKKHKQN